MTELLSVPLSGRGVLRLGGGDARAFLQGLISNDVGKLDGKQALWAAFLTAQGKYLHDFFVVAHGDGLLLEGEAGRLADLKRRLSIYRLRSKVVLEDVPELAVWALPGIDAAAALGLSGEPAAVATLDDGVVFADPRLPAAGARALLPRTTAAASLARRGFAEAPGETYDRLRIGLGLPDGSRDLLVERSFILEFGFDELGGVDWQKGCYLGQELTARMRYRNLVRRRLVPVGVDGALPASGTPVLDGDSEVGEVRSGVDGLALALLRIEAITSADSGRELRAGTARLTPMRPDWLILPALPAADVEAASPVKPAPA